MFKLGREFEKEMARRLNLKPISGSGNQWSKKGDLQSDNFLIECKSTGARQIPLRLDHYEKIKKEAQEKLKTPVMLVRIQNQDFIVLPLDLVSDRQVEELLNA